MRNKKRCIICNCDIEKEFGTSGITITNIDTGIERYMCYDCYDKIRKRRKKMSYEEAKKQVEENPDVFPTNSSVIHELEIMTRIAKKDKNEEMLKSLRNIKNTLFGGE